jgi:uncharacterized protein (TIGR03000 family)
MKKFVGLAALGVVAYFMALPTPAAAGSFSIGGIGRIGSIGLGGYTGWRPGAFIGWRGYRRYDWSPRFYRRAWAADYYYPPAWTYSYPYAGSYYYPNAEVSYSAYYSPPAPVEVNAVTIRMSVPSGARVWFDGEATSQTGADREFVSPPLTPGRQYVYHVRVQWDENGKAVERNRDVTVHAGDRINLNIDK